MLLRILAAGASIFLVVFAGSPCQAAPQPKYDMTGQWQSNHGAISMQQKGTDLTGTSLMSNGLTATFQAKLDGDKMSFTWSAGNKTLGSGTLSTSDNGNHWSGPYTESTKSTQSNWTMGRPVAPKVAGPKDARPKNGIDITGHWRSQIGGSFDFQQTGDNVEGTWTLVPGLNVKIVGTMNKYQFDFTAEMNDTQVGQGTLQLSTNQQRLDGRYLDQLHNQTLGWTLIRD